MHVGTSTKQRALQAFDGLMLGDGGLTRYKRGAHYFMAQSKQTILISDHIKWVQWVKDNVFMIIGVQVPNRYPRIGTGTYKEKIFQKAYLRTRQSSLLADLYDEWYIGGELARPKYGWYIHKATKIVPERLMQATTLPALTLVHWFLGDGGSSWARRNGSVPLPLIKFSTEGFIEKEVYHLSFMLNSMGIDTIEPGKAEAKKGSGLSIRLAQHSINYFMDLIEPHILEIFGNSEGPSYKDMIKRKLPNYYTPDYKPDPVLVNIGETLRVLRSRLNGDHNE